MLRFWVVLLCVVCGSAVSAVSARGEGSDGPIRVMVITGGHDFDRDAFFGMWNSMQGITWKETQHPSAFAIFKPENHTDIDVFVFYDSPTTISDEAKADLVQLVRSGKPVLFMHHALCSYSDWSEFPQIIGSQYVRKTYSDKGVTYPPSEYKHDVNQKIRVSGKRHAITRGVSDFEIIDETYGKMRIFPGNKVLLTSDSPIATPPVLWTRKYGKGQVVSFQLGHDGKAFANPAFRQLLLQSVEYAYRKGKR